MKTYKRLYTQIHAYDNLYAAWKQARWGKRYLPTVAAFERNLADELLT